MPTAFLVQGILGAVLILSSLGVILLKKPVHACLSFLLTLLTLALLYLELSSEFIAILQILVYAGAILVIFMFVIVLFQDAHDQIALHKARSSLLLLSGASLALIIAYLTMGERLTGIQASPIGLSKGFGTVEYLGRALYLDFFFPFEAVILVFLVAIIGAHFIGKK